ncbi:hypothetical protein [Legionella nautarum]|nr:hypothetical protein [Legionella nautarum]
MHFSDVYQIIKKMPKTDFVSSLVEKLKALEKNANTPNFIEFLTNNPVESSQDIFALRKDYDFMQFDKIIKGIDEILEDLKASKENARKNISDNHLDAIENILQDILSAAHQQKQFYDFYNERRSFYELAKTYATHYVPFNQENDPFKGTDFTGYCWGHTHQYGKLISEGQLRTLSDASNEELYKTNHQNWTFSDILFRRVGWYFRVSQEQKIRAMIWDVLKNMDTQATFNFNFLITNRGFHSTSLRMVGSGLEYYESNYGVVKFNTREAAVNFLAGHLLNEAMVVDGEVKFITVYKLPYANDPTQDMFADLPIAALQKEEVPEIEPKHSEKLQDAISALNSYIQVLREQGAGKGMIKANELQYLVAELKSLPTEDLKERVDGILANKNHSLMLNRGTGFYFFKSGFQSHSTTESLLQEISKAAEASVALQDIIVNI